MLANVTCLLQHSDLPHSSKLLTELRIDVLLACVFVSSFFLEIFMGSGTP